MEEKATKMEESNLLDRIGALKERGTLRDPGAIDWLERCLDDPDERTQEAACRAIVEEVVGSDHKELRLRALERLNREHPAYQKYPLLLLPGSDYHGRFSPRCPLGLGKNCPADGAGYRQQVLEALGRKAGA